MKYAEIFNGYDLRAKYSEFNRLYFDNALPTIPVTFSDKMKGMAGRARCKLTRAHPKRPRMGKYDGVVAQLDTLNIQISSKFKKSEKDFDTTLIHEMIHVFFFVSGNLGENHGYGFQRMARKISSESGLTISITEPVDNTVELADDTLKKIGVMLITKKNGTYSFACMSVAVARTVTTFLLEKQFNNWNRQFPLVSIAVYLIETKTWTKIAASHPLKRDPSKGSMNRLPNNNAPMLELIEKGQLLVKYP